jgi:hypothetical protein
MEQQSMFAVDGVNIPQLDAALDPAKYDVDRHDCLHPALHPQSAYRYGCRCIGCRKYRSAWAARIRAAPMPCKVEGCNNPRRRKQGAVYCADHATSLGYSLTGINHTTVESSCPSCETSYRRERSARRPFCPGCNTRYAGIVLTAARHHVPTETLVGWVKCSASLAKVDRQPVRAMRSGDAVRRVQHLTWRARAPTAARWAIPPDRLPHSTTSATLRAGQGEGGVNPLEIKPPDEDAALLDLCVPKFAGGLG